MISFQRKRLLKQIRDKEISPETGLKKMAEADSILGVDMVLFEEKVEETALVGKTDSKEGMTLIFCESIEDCEKYKNYFYQNGKSYVCVLAGENYKKISDELIIIQPNSDEDYEVLIKEITACYGVPTQVIYMWHQKENDSEKQVQLSLISISLLTKAYIKCNCRSIVRLCFCCSNSQGNISPVYTALKGYFKVIQSEDFHYQYRLIECDQELSFETIMSELQNENQDEYISYRNGLREITYYESVPLTDQMEKDSVLTENGVYCIVGGLGAIGTYLSQYMLKKYHATLVIIGRKKRDEINKKLEDLSSLGGKVHYYSVNICIKEEILDFANQLKAENLNLNGIIFCAGILQDAFIRNKTKEEIVNTIEAKQKGLIQIDECFEHEKLDFFAIFSSISAFMGFSGQSDYAYANSFADAYALMREKQKKAGLRYGKTVSINWSIWKDSSMNMSQEEKEYVEQSMIEKYGIYPMEKEDGLEIFEEALKSDRVRYIPVYGDVVKLKAILKNRPPKERITENINTISNNSVYAKIRNFVVELFERALELPKHRIEDDVELREYGIDSIMVNHFNQLLETMVKRVPQTLLYDCATVKDVIDYLYENNLEEISAVLDLNIGKNEEKPNKQQADKDIKQCTEEDVAIIGLDVVAPGACDYEELWKRLSNKEDCITFVPKERWDISEYFEEESDVLGNDKTYCKCGGFVDDCDKFDATFFNISPREARAMDPQERMFLQSVWRVIEDAGYTPAMIREMTNKNVGIFAGVTSNTYLMWADNQLRKGKEYYPQSFPWSVANRVSYLLDFHGPSIAIDTACSSSLTAVYLAYQSIKNQECELAIAGGVNLLLHPLKYIMQSNKRMLSKTGRCQVFNDNADGYVPGEAVGSIILKPFQKALEDNDNIYGVIKACVVNHGGIATGYTVPNTNAQAELVDKALKNSHINPRTISYIEAHGTGTSLGDPIEVQGLTKAFRRYVQDKQFCAIGSVKSNIGHTEAAAGVISIAKVLLQMKYKKIPPSLHSKPLNHRINFEESPFYVADELTDWTGYDGEQSSILRSGISCFGAGGSNAHLILEENTTTCEYEGEALPIVFVSAKTKNSLYESIKNLTNYLMKEKDSLSLNQLLYSLQVSRMAHEERCAFIARTIDEVIEGLNKVLSGDTDPLACFVGNIRDEDKNQTIDFHKDELITVAEKWVTGANIDWTEVYGNKLRKRLVIPTYPFEKKSYWFDTIETNNDLLSVCETKTDEEETEASDLELNYSKELNELASNDRDKVNLQIIDREIAIIRMEHKEESNMLTTPLYASLLSKLNCVNENDEIKVVVITGYDNVFCMGGNADKLLDIADQKETCARGSLVYKGLLSLKVPVIAAMQGHAFGGGFIFGLFADIIVMATEGMYSANFMRYGFTPGVGSTYILKEKLGMSIANEMMYSAREFTGSELQRRGVDFVYQTREEVLNEAIKIARGIAQNKYKSLCVLKKNLSNRIFKDLMPVIHQEVKMHGDIFEKSELGDIKERISHFFHNDIKDANAIPKLKLNSKNHTSDLEDIVRTNGKIRLKPYGNMDTASIKTVEEKKELKINQSSSSKSVCQKCIQIIADRLHTDEDIDVRCSFMELGVDSITGVEIIREINKNFNINLEAVITYDFKDITSFIQYVEALCNKTQPKTVDLEKCNENETYRNMSREQSRKDVSDVTDRVIRLASKVLRLNQEDIDIRLSMRELGMDSITGLEFIRDINKEFHLNLEAVIIYDFSDLQSFIQTITDKTLHQKMPVSTNNIEQMLQMLKSGKIDIETVDSYLEDNV